MPTAFSRAQGPTVELEQTGNVWVLRFKGRFRTGADQEYLSDKLNEIKSLACGKVLADFEEVQSIGSAAVSFIVGIYASVTRSGSGRFVLAGAQPRVREVLELTRLTDIIEMVPDRATGLAVLSR